MDNFRKKYVKLIVIFKNLSNNYIIKSKIKIINRKKKRRENPL